MAMKMLSIKCTLGLSGSVYLLMLLYILQVAIVSSSQHRQLYQLRKAVI